MKKQSSWFSHDSNASLDPKIIALTATHGIAGYGRWWRLVEILRAEERYRYNITTPFAYSVLSKELVCTTDEAKQFIHDCIHSYQLLHTDDEYIWSTSLCGRMQHMDDKIRNSSEGGKKSARIRKEKKAAMLQQASNTLETPLQPISTKEIKQNETKENKTTTSSDGEGGEIETVKEEKNAETQSALVPPLDRQTEQSSVRSGGGGGWNALKQQALQDTNFTYTIISTGKVSMQQLDQWLDAFNRILTIRGEAAKSSQDYRMHFLNWFKFRDPAKEDPNTFLTPEPRNKAPVVISTQSFLKTPQQIEEEQKQRQNLRSNRLG